MKKKTKKLNFIIPLVIYPFDVMVSIGETHEELNKRLKRYDISLDQEESDHFDRTSLQGRTILFPTGQTILRLKKVPETPFEYGVLAHEIFHAATFILHRVGIKLELQTSDEAYSYLIGYLTAEIYIKIF